MTDTSKSSIPAGAELEHALLLHGLGFSLVPVPLPRQGVTSGQPGDGKVPSLPWKPYQATRASLGQIRDWFRTPHNVAIVTGAVSNLVVVDADSDEALAWATKRLPWTPRQVKTPRGWHLYYRHPAAPIRNRARMQSGDGTIALDVRGDGGYVIGPWSLHASGQAYHCVGDWDAPAESVPVFDPAWLTEPRPAPQKATGTARTFTSSAPVLDRARKYLASIPKPEIGMGSDAASLYAACRLTRGFALSEGDAIALLEDWAGGRPGWSRDWLATKVQHALRYGSEPMGGLL